jgi:hypothetical protein
MVGSNDSNKSRKFQHLALCFIMRLNRGEKRNFLHFDRPANISYDTCVKSILGRNRKLRELRSKCPSVGKQLQWRRPGLSWIAARTITGNACTGHRSDLQGEVNLESLEFSPLQVASQLKMLMIFKAQRLGLFREEGCQTWR